MSIGVEVSENELSIPIDYVPGVRGHAVLAVGPDSGGGDALAVWRLGPTGVAGGAWVVRLDEIEREPEQLRRIMWNLQDRCLIDWDRETPVGVLARVAEVVPAELLSKLEGTILALPDLLEEIREHRSSYSIAVEQHRTRVKSKIAPLAWATQLPSQEHLATWAAKDRFASASQVAATALAVTAAVARTAQLWQDTEQARYRRAYLRPLGDPQPLPPLWLARLRKAVHTNLSVSA
ncbi:DUF6218 family protein [Micromonospora foliorum]|uniref:DUF6218 family protein n=1 Tax=Micromonospora foliorum TaxID=2911210 RepID=UPI001EE7F50B|nr:DUF6218 family protein [Micromonospora foliorum]MCG5440780.1 DUF6218 family protein [Micromonospora foliorum]